jgi:hypothetical protein
MRGHSHIPSNHLPPSPVLLPQPEAGSQIPQPYQFFSPAATNASSGSQAPGAAGSPAADPIEHFAPAQQSLRPDSLFRDLHNKIQIQQAAQEQRFQLLSQLKISSEDRDKALRDLEDAKMELQEKQDILNHVAHLADQHNNLAPHQTSEIVDIQKQLLEVLKYLYDRKRIRDELQDIKIRVANVEKQLKDIDNARRSSLQSLQEERDEKVRLESLRLSNGGTWSLGEAFNAAGNPFDGQKEAHLLAQLRNLDNEQTTLEKEHAYLKHQEKVLSEKKHGSLARMKLRQIVNHGKGHAGSDLYKLAEAAKNAPPVPIGYFNRPMLPDGVQGALQNPIPGAGQAVYSINYGQGLCAGCQTQAPQQVYMPQVAATPPALMVAVPRPAQQTLYSAQVPDASPINKIPATVLNHQISETGNAPGLSAYSIIQNAPISESMPHSFQDYQNIQRAAVNGPDVRHNDPALSVAPYKHYQRSYSALQYPSQMSLSQLTQHNQGLEMINGIQNSLHQQGHSLSNLFRRSPPETNNVDTQLQPDLPEPQVDPELLAQLNSAAESALLANVCDEAINGLLSLHLCSGRLPERSIKKRHASADSEPSSLQDNSVLAKQSRCKEEHRRAKRQAAHKAINDKDKDCAMFAAQRKLQTAKVLKLILGFLSHFEPPKIDLRDLIKSKPLVS